MDLPSVSERLSNHKLYWKKMVNIYSNSTGDADYIMLTSELTKINLFIYQRGNEEN